MAIVTWWASLTSTQGRSESLSWPELWALLDASGQDPHRGERSQPGWSPALFERDKRSKDGVKEAYAVGLDFDDGALTIQQVADQLRGMRSYIHTTKSHTASCPRFRAVVALSRAVSVEEYGRCWKALADGFDGHVDPATKDASRFWYMPSSPMDDGPFESRIIPGREAVVEAMLEATLPNPEPVKRAVGDASSAERASAEAWIVKAIAKLAMAPAGERNAALNSAACTIYGKPEYVRIFGDAYLQEELTAVARRIGLTDDEIRKTIDSGKRAGAAKPIAATPRMEPVLAGTRQGLHLVTAPDPDAPPKPFIEVKWEADIFAELPPTRWVVKGLHIGPGRPGIVMGYGDSAKTLSLQSLALSVATDSLVWGNFVPDRGKVIHLDYEQGWAASARRYQRLAIGMGIDPRAYQGVLGLAALPSGNLCSPQAFEGFLQVCDGAQLVILDSIKAATPGINENDSVIREFLDILTRVSEKTGTSFMMVHHAGKPKQGHDDQRTVGRGSSAIFDAAGCQLSITPGLTPRDPRTVRQTKRPAESEGAGVGEFTLTVTDVEQHGSPTAGVKVTYGRPEDNEPEVEQPNQNAMRKLVSNAACVEMFIGDNPGCSQSMIGRMTPVSKRSELSAALNHLVSEGRVEVQKDGVGYTYTVNNG